MYSNKLAAAIKSNGKVLREFGDTVYIPFNSEYSILIKNLNTVRTVVNVYLDGENVVPGGLVINANSEIDLERWIKNGNLTDGNRFKFIERTANIEDHRGIKLEDGLIRIEYQFEKVYNFNGPLYGGLNYPIGVRGILGSPEMTYGSVCATNSVLRASASDVTVKSFVANDAGITVPGSHSTQKFQTVNSFPTETEKHTLIFKLLGETPDNKPILQPVTVKAKPKCTTCGHTNKATSKFCNKCGTSLEIFA